MPQTIRFRGETYPVLDCFHLGRRDYLVLKSLSGGLRERYKAYHLGNNNPHIVPAAY